MKTRLAVIPARAGSTRIPGKNWKMLGGADLVGHAHNAAKAAGVQTVAMSTDASFVYGMDIVERPAELCAPTADIKDAVRHALIEMEDRTCLRFDEVLTLQPTLPIRPLGLIRKMLGVKQLAGARSALTVMPCVPWMWRVEGDRATNDWHPGPYPRSQDVRHGYFQEINSVTIADRDVVLAGKRWDLPLLLCELPRWAYIDIDWPEDLEEARAIWPFVKDRPIGELKTHLITEINGNTGNRRCTLINADTK